MVLQSNITPHIQSAKKLHDLKLLVSNAKSPQVKEKDKS